MSLEETLPSVKYSIHWYLYKILKKSLKLLEKSNSKNILRQDPSSGEK
jgi:hypothetical protein